MRSSRCSSAARRALPTTCVRRHRKRLIEAFEKSGLSREDYQALVRSQDPATNEVTDEAFAELSAQTAKREALQRAFAASGKTVAEFAEMYGLDPREVDRTLSDT